MGFCVNDDIWNTKWGWNCQRTQAWWSNSSNLGLSSPQTKQSFGTPSLTSDASKPAEDMSGAPNYAGKAFGNPLETISYALTSKWGERTKWQNLEARPDTFESRAYYEGE